MRVMVLKPGELAEVINIKAAEIAEIVDGVPEAIFPFDDKIGIYVNEQGKILGLPKNRSLYDDDGAVVDVFAGTMVIASEDGDLTDEEIVKLLAIFGDPDPDLDEELEDCLDRLIGLLERIFLSKEEK